MAKHWGTVLLSLTLIFGLSLSARAQQPEDPRADTQFWPELQVFIRLRPSVNLNFVGTVRAGRNLTALVNEQVGVGLGFGLGQYLSFSPTYRYIATQPTPARRSHEHRFSLDLALRVPLPAGMTLTDRHRGELRGIDGSLAGRYRNRLQLERTFVIRDRRVTPYAADEIFYDGRYHAWNRNRFYAGARLALRPRLTLDGYYARQTDGRARPGFLHIFGVITRLNL